MELAPNLTPPYAPTAASTTLLPFSFPRHLQRRWWESVAPELASAFSSSVAYDAFIQEFTDYARFKKLALPAEAAFSFLIGDETTLPQHDFARDLRLIVNIGESPALLSVESEEIILAVGQGLSLRGASVSLRTTEAMSVLFVVSEAKPSSITQASELIPGIKVYSALPSDVKARDRVRLSAGTSRNTPVTDSRYRENAILPRGPWREPSIEEASQLWTNDYQLAANTTIALLKMPLKLHETFQSLKLDDLKSSDEYAVLRKSDAFRDATLQVLEFLEPFRQNAEPFEIAAIYTPPGLPCVTFDRPANNYVGLHFDDWDRLPLSQRGLGQNRILLNLGSEAREFMIFNLPVEELMSAVRAGGIEIGESHAEWRDLLQAFHSLYPNYPVMKLRIEPGEAYIAPTENLIHDGTTLGREHPDINLQVRGYIWPREALPSS